MNLLVSRYFFITYLKKILRYKYFYFKTIVSLDHIVEGVDCQVVVDDLLLALALLVCKLEVNIYYFLYLSTALLYI